jgi:hypothetical protein
VTVGTVLEEAGIESDVVSGRAFDAFRSDHRAVVDAAMRHLLGSLEMDGPDSEKSQS